MFLYSHEISSIDYNSQDSNPIDFSKNSRNRISSLPMETTNTSNSSVTPPLVYTNVSQFKLFKNKKKIINFYSFLIDSR